MKKNFKNPISVEEKISILRFIILKSIFAPQGKDSDSWLRNYSNTIDKFLQTGGLTFCSVFEKEKMVKFCSVPLGFDFDLTFKNTDSEFDATLYIKSNIKWRHHVDKNYRTLFSHLFIPQNLKPVISECTDIEVEKVLDDLIFHPEVHQHCDDIEGFPHNFRIGGGINNGYQFLMHLRFQLLPDENARQNEKARLCKVVLKHIKKKSIIKKIPLNELF